MYSMTKCWLLKEALAAISIEMCGHVVAGTAKVKLVRLSGVFGACRNNGEKL